MIDQARAHRGSTRAAMIAIGRPRGMRIPMVALALLLVLPGLLGALPRGARADDTIERSEAIADDPIHSELREFFATGKYVLYLGGTLQREASILHSRKAGAFLILGSDYGRALLIEPRTKTVSALPPDQVALRPDKGYDLIAAAQIQKLGDFSLAGGDVVISIGALRARMRPQPYLIGLKSRDEVVLHSPEYERDGESYTPDAGAIRRLEAYDRSVVVRVYFGSWCHTCARLLPRILTVGKALEGSRIQFEYYGLPKGAQAMARDPLARRYSIKRIPTGVVKVDGRDVGQINSTQFASPEGALLAMLPQR
jgi:thiol-disulfide isomerase/thioredoxin